MKTIILFLSILEINRKLLLFYSLAACDTALIVDMMAQKFVTYYLEYPAWYNVTYSYFWHPVKGICVSATILMIVAVSIERYRSICHPFRQRHVRITN